MSSFVPAAWMLLINGHNFDFSIQSNFMDIFFSPRYVCYRTGHGMPICLQTATDKLESQKWLHAHRNWQDMICRLLLPIQFVWNSISIDRATHHLSSNNINIATFNCRIFCDWLGADTCCTLASIAHNANKQFKWKRATDGGGSDF